MSSDGVNKPPVTTFAQAYLALSKNPEPEIMDGKAAEEGSIDVKKSGVLPHNNNSISNEKKTDGKSAIWDHLNYLIGQDDITPKTVKIKNVKT